LDHLIVLDQFSVIGAGVLATPIGLHNQSGCWFAVTILGERRFEVKQYKYNF
jgi:hypothetical protein